MNELALFLYLTAFFCLLNGAAINITSFGHGFILQTPDRLTGLQCKVLFRFEGCIEIAIDLPCIFTKCLSLPTGLLVLLATSVLAFSLTWSLFVIIEHAIAW